MLKYVRLFSLFCLFSTLVFNVSANENKSSIGVEVINTQEEFKKTEDEDKIRALQKRLIDEGYYVGKINGMKTPETRRAVKAWSMDRD